MHIFLRLLAAVVFAVFFGVNIIYAQETYPAEVSFSGAGTFGFTLYHSNSDVLPVGDHNENVSTNTINWNDVTVVAGSNTFVNSRTYAYLEHDLAFPQEVFIYTDNANGKKYKFTSASTTTYHDRIPSFVETSSTGTAVAVNPDRRIDLAYIIISTAQYGEKRFSKSENEGGPTGISDIYIGLEANDSGEANYGTGFAKDKSNSDVENNGKGLPAANAYGYFAGYAAAGGAHYVYYPGTNAYMFFSANFGKAIISRYYGTDTLTIELSVPGP